MLWCLTCDDSPCFSGLSLPMPFRMVVVGDRIRLPHRWHRGVKVFAPRENLFDRALRFLIQAMLVCTQILGSYWSRTGGLLQRCPLSTNALRNCWDSRLNPSFEQSNILCLLMGGGADCPCKDDIIERARTTWDAYYGAARMPSRNRKKRVDTGCERAASAGGASLKDFMELRRTSVRVLQDCHRIVLQLTTHYDVN